MYELLSSPKIVHQIKYPKLIPKTFSAPLLKIIDYPAFVNLLEKDKVLSVELTNNSQIMKVSLDDDEVDVSIPNEKHLDLMNKLNKYDIDLNFKENKDYTEIIVATAIYVVTGLLLLQIFLNSRKPPSIPFLQNTVVEAKATNVKFDDVAGLKNAKEDLIEIVEFLKNPDKFSKLGAKIPKGCLLESVPGCGKTLLARAISGEAGVPFFSASGSGFIEMFVGTGASRIRDLFKNAKEKAPSIIFIDEIDAIGRARGGANINGGTDEREQTINQLLVEMDGFHDNTGVIVIAATNRADILDPALLRPGRFDRIITLEPPDYNDRIQILKVHTRNKPLADDFNIESVAKATIGLTGADLANLANEAAILAARNNKNTISNDDFDNAFEKIAIGPKKDVIISPEKRKLIAYHEAGHALVALKVGVFDTLKKVSIISRGKTGGVTIFEPNEENSDLKTLEYLENQIAVALGGRISEEIIFGPRKITTGASSDINLVYNLARHIITLYGFNKKLGPIAWHANYYSDNTSANIDNEITLLVNLIYNKTKILVLKYKNELDMIANLLLEKEIVNVEEILKITGPIKIC